VLETLSYELSNNFEAKKSKKEQVYVLEYIFLEIIIFLTQLMRVFV